MIRNFVLGESTIKFYNATTGEEILPMSEEELKASFQRGKEKEESLKEIRKQTGYVYPELCPSCGEYYEGYSGRYEINGDVKCCHCVKTDDRLNLPHFIPHIPAYVDGATRRIFTFKDSNDLYDKIKIRLNEGEILVKGGDYIMSQSIDKSYWWVFGHINNYNMGLLNIPEFDSEIYNEDKTVNVAKMNEWIKDKEIIKGNKDES